MVNEYSIYYHKRGTKVGMVIGKQAKTAESARKSFKKERPDAVVEIVRKRYR